MHVTRGVLNSERFQFRRFRKKIASLCVVQLKVSRCALDKGDLVRLLVVIDKNCSAVFKAKVSLQARGALNQFIVESCLEIHTEHTVINKGKTAEEQADRDCVKHGQFCSQRERSHVGRSVSI